MRSALLRLPITSASTCFTSIRSRPGRARPQCLCDALEKLAAARGAKELSVDASDTARGFFEKRGFVAKTRNTVSLAGEWLANTTMVKPLAAAVPDRGTLP